MTSIVSVSRSKPGNKGIMVGLMCSQFGSDHSVEGLGDMKCIEIGWSTGLTVSV